MGVSVVGRRLLLEPPELGDCDDSECSAISPAELERQSPSHELRPGIDVLLVAKYTAPDPRGDRTEGRWRRVCAACDERALRRWMADDEADGA